MSILRPKNTPETQLYELVYKQEFTRGGGASYPEGAYFNCQFPEHPLVDFSTINASWLSSGTGMFNRLLNEDDDKNWVFDLYYARGYADMAAKYSKYIPRQIKYTILVESWGRPANVVVGFGNGKVTNTYSASTNYVPNTLTSIIDDKYHKTKFITSNQTQVLKIKGGINLDTLFSTNMTATTDYTYDTATAVASATIGTNQKLGVLYINTFCPTDIDDTVTPAPSRGTKTLETSWPKILSVKLTYSLLAIDPRPEAVSVTV